MGRFTQAPIARRKREPSPELIESWEPAPAGGDHIRLRGIPAIGRGVCGAVTDGRPGECYHGPKQKCVFCW